MNLCAKLASVSPNSTVGIIQTTLTRIVDSVANLEHISEVVTDRELADLLQDIAESRRERIEDLSWLLASCGESPIREPSSSYSVHKAWIGFIRHLISIPDLRFAHELEQQERRLAHRIANVADQFDSREAHILKGIGIEIEADAELITRYRTILEAYGRLSTGGKRRRNPSTRVGPRAA